MSNFADNFMPIPAIIDLCHGTAALKKTNQVLVSAPIFKVTDQSAIILKIVIFIRLCMVNGQGLPFQLICHTKPYKNRNFQIDGAL